MVGCSSPSIENAGPRGAHSGRQDIRGQHPLSQTKHRRPLQSEARSNSTIETQFVVTNLRRGPCKISCCVPRADVCRWTGHVPQNVWKTSSFGDGPFAYSEN